MKYCGQDIIHEYRGYEIKKVTHYYMQGSEYTYQVGNEVFFKLKEAKQFIDKLLEK